MLTSMTRRRGLLIRTQVGGAMNVDQNTHHGPYVNMIWQQWIHVISISELKENVLHDYGAFRV